MTTIVIGIDPGLTGALALLRDEELLGIADMPTCSNGKEQGMVIRKADARALANTLREWGAGRSDEVMVAVESQASMGTEGRSVLFSLGHTFGVIEGVLGARGYMTHFVRPQEWKKSLGLIRAGKDASREMALKLYPAQAKHLSRRKDHNRAEAVLLARWAWQNLR
jgi:crossover junction endodeoxyribonuclease RuvC